MKILLADQVKEADAYTIANEPIASTDLMERAAKGCSNWITKNFMPDKASLVLVFVGPGNNGGDGLAIARLLADENFKVKVFLCSENLSEDASINLKRLNQQKKAIVVNVSEISDIPEIQSDDIVVDALFGSGLSRVLEDMPANVVDYINNSNATVISIDIPSGLFSEESPVSGSFDPLSLDETEVTRSSFIAVKADYTLTFEQPFLSFFYPETVDYVGDWTVIPIGLHKGFIEDLESKYFYITKETIKLRLAKRSKFSHKGTYGHALLVSGSYGKMGAAVMASKACLRSGVGLLTTHIPKFGYEIMQTAVPEAMLSIDRYNKVSSEIPYINNYSAIGIGPGIGKSNATQTALKEVIERTNSPIVFDADAINILAENRDYLEKNFDNCVFTPHPKEFERIAGYAENHIQRIELQLEFAMKYNTIVVLKGAHTSIACPDGKCYFNSTGNPGMATAGSGDVLTGIILSFLAKGYSAKDAALIGVYIHGLAGDIAKEKYGEEALIASDIIEYIGSAFLSTKSKAFRD